MLPKKLVLCATLLAALLVLVSRPIFAQPGTASIILTVDATDAPRKLLHTKESVAVIPGKLTLFYPKWIPGEHGPTGPVIDMAGLKITADGKTIAWKRDLEEMYEIHCEIPSGTDTIDVAFDFILPSTGRGLFFRCFFNGAAPGVKLEPSHHLPAFIAPRWHHRDSEHDAACRMEICIGADHGQPANNSIFFAPVTLTTLIDSPLLTGHAPPPDRCHSLFRCSPLPRPPQ